MARFAAALRAGGVARLAACSLFLWLGAAGLGHAQVPAKQIWFYNDSPETLYAVLISGARKIDEWLQARETVPKAERPARKWTTTKDFRIYLNGKRGIPPGGHFKISVPFYTLLVPRAQEKEGTGKNLAIDWWNGGRLAIYDRFGAAAFAQDYDADAKAGALIKPGSNNVPAAGSANQRLVACLEGACAGNGALNMFGRVGGLPDTDPSQLTEFTFGDAITAGNPEVFPFFYENVGYNISSVDQVYLPVAMEPVGNRFIPYIGSVLSPARFRNIEKRWLAATPGWPVYKGFTPNNPRIPEAHIVFLNGFNSNGSYDRNGPLTRPGAPVVDMRRLFAVCMGSNPPKTANCKRIQDVMNGLFIPNFANYHKICNPTFANTPLEQLRHLYGWVAYTENGCAANSLQDTPVNGVPITVEQFEKLHNEYLGLEYNYRTLADKTQWFNPYVQLIHGVNYLDMAVYAFSTDDRLGFVHFRGNGLIYAVGSDKHLPNKDAMDKKKIVTVSLGDPVPLNRPAWVSAGLCNKAANDLKLQPKQLAFDFFPPLATSSANPCTVTVADAKKRLYQFNLTVPGPNPKFQCTGVSNPAWCAGSNVKNSTVNTPPPDPFPKE